MLEKSEVLVAGDLRGNTVLKQALLRRNKKYFVVGDLRGHIVFVAIQRERERERERERDSQVLVVGDFRGNIVFVEPKSGV